MTIQIETSKSGVPTAKLQIGEKELYLHSKYDPVKEAVRNIGSLEGYGLNTVFILFGLGLGYNLYELSKYARENLIIILEPNEELYLYSKELEHIKPIIENENVISLAGNACFNIYEILKQNTSIENYNHFKLYTLPYYDKIYADFYSQLLSIIHSYNLELQVQVNAIEKLSSQISRNLAENLPYIIEGYSIISFKEIFKDCPAVIVSAGPSLEKNIDELKDVQDKAVIFAGVRTLKPLLDRGIIPHFLCNIDPQDITYELAKDHMDLSIPVISLVHGNHILVEEWKGKKIFITDDKLKNLVEYIFGERQDTIEVGGSVANSSTAIATYMGCNPLILVGQDLAFTDQKHHSDIASKVCEEDQKESSGDLLVEDIYGNRIPTSSQLYYYLNWFENYIKDHSNNTFIDATEGGAKIKGTKIMTLKDTIIKYCDQHINPKDKIKLIMESKGNNVYYKGIEKLKNVLKELRVIKKCSKSNLEWSLELKRYYEGKSREKFNKILYQLDRNDEAINKAVLANELLFYYKQPGLLQIAQEFEPKIIEKEENAYQRILEKNEKLYKLQYNAAVHFEKTIETLIEENEIKLLTAFIKIQS